MNYSMDKLGSHIDILSGFAFKSSDFIETGIPVIKIKNVTPPSVTLEDLSFVSEEVAEQQSKFLLEPDDVLIALTGSHINQMASVVGRVARVKYNVPSLLNQRVGKITILNPAEANIDYIYYFLSQDSVKIELASKAGGAANQANISPTDIKNLIIPFPDIAVQNKIASILLAYDNLIENNQKQNKIASILLAYDNLIENNQKQIKLLEEAAKRLYKEWFIDLRFPGHESTPIHNGIPEGWEKKAFSAVFSYVRGRSYSSKELSDDGILMANLKNIRAFGGYNRGAEKRYIGEYKDCQLLSAGDIIMGVTDMTQERRLVGHVAVVPDVKEPMVFSMDLIKLLPITCPKSYLYSALQFGGLSDRISPLANGVNVLHLKPEAMMNLKMVVPDETTMLKFDEAFSAFQSRIEILQNQSTAAEEARDRLLPKLMSGEIEV